MSDELLSVLTDDGARADELAPNLDNHELWSLYEGLVLTRTIDEHCAEMQGLGELGFFVPSGEAMAVSVGAAWALQESDWLFPGFRDAGAFLVRGGGVEQLMAQVLGAGDALSKGRAAPGHGSLPDGRFVSVSGSLGAHLQHATGTAMAMQLREADTVALALFGGGSAQQPAFHLALEQAARAAAPVLFVCRSRPTLSPSAAARAHGHGVATVRVDGVDVLAVVKAVRDARKQALAGGGPLLIEAVLPVPTEGEDTDLGIRRLRPYLEHRGVWDPGREEELLQESTARVAQAAEAALAAGPPPVASLLDDVTAEPGWVQRQQAEWLPEDV